MSQLTGKPSRRKGAAGKPHPDFPLFLHARGYWAKKVRGKLHYFGKVTDDPKGENALDLWLNQKDDLLAGRTPRVHRGGLVVRELIDRFMVAKRHLLDTGELGPRTFGELFATCERVGKAFGLKRPVDDLVAEDFEKLRQSIAKQWGPVRLGNEVQRVRSVFKYGFEAGLIDKQVRFGPAFKKPSRKVVRLARAAKGPRTLEAAELRKIIEAAGIPLRAMILLGINCGFGNSDVAALPITALDLQAGWVDFPRTKTGIPRRCPLWKETIKAIYEALDRRPEPKDPLNAGLTFITKYGGRWTKADIITPDPKVEGAKLRATADDAVCKEFAKLLAAIGLKRPGLGFYTLRHQFETIGGDSRDQVAVDAIMGHVDATMAANYGERIDDDRLKAVVDYVHKWLFPAAKKKRPK
jgi:integrase